MILEHDNGVIREDLDWIDCQMEFGDIVFFNSYIPHKSGRNISKYPRKSLYITYNLAEEGDLRTEYYKEKNKIIDNNKISLIDHYDGKIVDKSKNKKINDILNLYLSKGETMYDNNITQLEHSLQVTELAKNQGYSDQFQLICFLHDIGHLLLDENKINKNFLENDLYHEMVGYNFLI